MLQRRRGTFVAGKLGLRLAFVHASATAVWPPTGIALAAGNTIEGLVGAHLVRRFAGGRQPFEHARDVFKFAVLAAVVSTAPPAPASLGVRPRRL